MRQLKLFTRKTLMLRLVVEVDATRDELHQLTISNTWDQVLLIVNEEDLPKRPDDVRSHAPRAPASAALLKIYNEWRRHICGRLELDAPSDPHRSLKILISKDLQSIDIDKVCHLQYCPRKEMISNSAMIVMHGMCFAAADQLQGPKLCYI